MKLKITYLVNGKKFVNESDHLKINETFINGRYTVKLLPATEITIKKVMLELDDERHPGELFMSNGFQSWTETKELGKKDKIHYMPRTAQTELIFRLTKYGDYEFVHYRKQYSHTYTYLRKGGEYRFYGSVDEMSGYTIFFLQNNHLWATKDDKNHVISEEMTLFDLVIAQGSESEVFDAYAAAFGKELPIEKRKYKGYTSWYRHYEHISEEKLLRDLKSIEAKHLPFEFFQIDDGYQTKIGDWLSFKPKEFPNGLDNIVKEAKKGGLKPGIWLAPFCASKHSKVWEKHPDWFLRDHYGLPIYQGFNWDGAYALDFDNPEVKKYLHKVFQTLIEAGFELFKLDFLYAAALAIKPNETRAGRMKRVMDWIREELKGKYIIGCGVPLWPAFYNVDFCRIGPDISLIWDDKWFMRNAHRERISTKVTIENTYFRRQLDGRFFLNDPDVILRKGTDMTQSQKDLVLLRAKEYGSLYFTSDDVSLYTSDDIKTWKNL